MWQEHLQIALQHYILRPVSNWICIIARRIGAWSAANNSNATTPNNAWFSAHTGHFSDKDVFTGRIGSS